MEKWERNHIIKNLPALIENTTWNAKLSSCIKRDQILSTAELELVERVHDRKGNTEAANLIYNILMTRKNAYSKFLNILKENQQTGAAEILSNAYLPAETELEPKNSVDRKAKTKPAEFCKESYIENPSSGKGNTSLGDKSIPQNSLYIPRSLTNRILLNKQVFQEECTDIFVFDGLEWAELRKLIRPHVAVASSNYTSQDRMYFLESPGDWDVLRKSTQHPIHLVKYETTDTFALERTSRITPILAEAMQKENMTNEKLFMTEKEFLEEINTTSNSHKGVCICDAPGMGKTQLLKSLALQLKTLYPDRIVVFQELSVFVPAASKVAPKLDHSTTSEQVINIIARGTKDKLLPQTFQEEMLFKKNTKLELFFDGFDEIQEYQLEWTKTFFKRVNSYDMKNIRLFVTARAHVKNELLETFSVSAYYMLPFTPENQMEYLIKAWMPSLEPGIHDESKLTDFAKKCVDLYKKDIGKNLIGIPLNCFFLSEYYMKYALMYSEITRNDLVREQILPIHGRVSVYHIYKDYMNTGFKIAMNCGYETYQELKQFHVWKALELIFPEISEFYLQIHQINKDDPIEKYLSSGILHIDKDNQHSLKFMHRSFAEYLVAEFFVDIILGQSVKSQADGRRAELILNIIKGFATSVLKTKQCTKGFFIALQSSSNPIQCWAKSYRQYMLYPLIIQFMESRLMEIDTNEVETFVAEMFISALENTQLLNILLASLHGHYYGILKLLESIFANCCRATLTSEKKRDLLTDLSINIMVFSSLQLDRYDLSISFLLNLTARQSNLPFVKQLFSFFRRGLDINLESFCEEMPLWMKTPLHGAAHVGSVDKVQFFLKFIKPANRTVLFYLADNSDQEKEAVIKNKKEICRILLDEDNSLISEKRCHVNQSAEDGICVVPRVHVELLKLFIENGADINVVKDYDNLVTHANQYMDEKQFNDLCEFLIERGASRLVEEHHRQMRASFDSQDGSNRT